MKALHRLIPILVLLVAFLVCSVPVWGEGGDDNDAVGLVTEIVEPTPTPLPLPGGFGGFGGIYVECPLTFTVDFQGEITEVSMKLDGRICEDCFAQSPDGMHLVEIFEGTKTVDAEGNIVKLIEIEEVESPSLPYATTLVGNAYDYMPSGVIFDQAVLITIGYDVIELPGDALALNMAFHGSVDGWTFVESEHDQIAGLGTVTGTTEHLTIFAILADIPSFEVSNLSIATSRSETWGFLTFVVTSGEEAVVSVDVTNNSNQEASHIVSLQVNGETRESQEVTLAPGQSERVTFTISGNERGHYTVVVDDMSAEFSCWLWINWWLIIGILGALTVIGIPVVWFYRRRVV